MKFAASTLVDFGLAAVFAAGLLVLLRATARRARGESTRNALVVGSRSAIATKPSALVAKPTVAGEQAVPAKISHAASESTVGTKRLTAASEMARLQTIIETSLTRAEAMSTAQSDAGTQLAAAEAALERLISDIRAFAPTLAAAASSSARAAHARDEVAATAAAPAPTRRAA